MDMDKYIGRLLDNRYEILEVIGAGGMAVVYKARCHRLNRLVAIKILKDDFSQDGEFRRRFHAESQAVAMLSHPNIVSVYDVSTSDEADYIVMELIDGISLKQYMEKKGVLNWKETLHFAIQIGKALDHAHSRGIIHRDIKPHNVMVLKNGSVKVTDFGIARVMSNSNSLTKEALGSVHYISPEQAKGGRVDNRSDLYSLGVVMYEMMTGRPPYDGESPVAVAIQHINGQPELPSTLNPNIPGGLEQIIMKAMAHAPQDRFNTAAAMLYDMDEFRKNPTVLFDYNNPNADIDDATRLRPNAGPEKPTAPLPTGGTTRTKGTQTRKRTDGPAKGQTRQPQRRPKEEIVEEHEKGSKVAVIAIVACAILILVAIVILGVGVINRINNDMLEVPNLVGAYFDDVANMTDFVILREDPLYSDEYPAGQIVRQKPSGGLAAKGSPIYVVVSLGPEPDNKVMEDLTDLPVENAIKFLVDVQGISEDIIFIRNETSTKVPEGYVIRTDPSKGEGLANVTSISIWVSSGPEVQMDTVPRVVGLDVGYAQTQLLNRGFENYELEMVDSTMDKGIVVGISVQEGAVLDVYTEIILYVSNGKGVETEPSTGPEIPTVDPDLQYMVVTILMPDDLVVDSVLSVWKNGELVEEIDIPAGTISRDVEISGKGVENFKFYLGDQLLEDMSIDFTEFILPDVPADGTQPTDPSAGSDPSGSVPEETTEPTQESKNWWEQLFGGW